MEGAVGAILLKDVQGAKCDIGAKSAIKKFIGSATQSPVNVLCGELLLVHANHDHYNYVLSRDSNVFMFCNDNNIAPLNHEEFLLLEAIKRPYDRITAFRRLEWGVNLKTGFAVYVTLPGDNLSVQERTWATVRYKGAIGNLPGIHFGVEIVVSSYQRIHHNTTFGTTDGTFQSKRYFTCQDDCGLFIPLHLVHPIEEFPSNSEFTSSESKPHTTTKGNSSQHNESEFKIDQRITFYNNKGVKHYGVVGWIGRETKTRKFPYAIVGIITVSNIMHDLILYDDIPARAWPGIMNL